jgi:hypothetical protein
MRPLNGETLEELPMVTSTEDSEESIHKGVNCAWTTDGNIPAIANPIISKFFLIALLLGKRTVENSRSDQRIKVVTEPQQNLS